MYFDYILKAADMMNSFESPSHEICLGAAILYSDLGIGRDTLEGVAYLIGRLLRNRQ